MAESEERRRTVQCAACGASVDPGSKFCPECGSATRRGSGLTCPACGVPHPESAGFCSQCGAHLGSVAQAERRVITVLFADLSGFTRLTEQLDPEVVHRLVSSCLEPLTDCVTRWGGYVDKFIGDCVMALFGAPAAYENEPERAVRAALDMQAAVRNWSPEENVPGGGLAGVEQPSLRIGVNTGSVVTGIFSGGGARDYTAVGDVVNVASRLQSHCEPGEVLVGDSTYRNLRHVCVFGDEKVLSVKGRQEPVPARRVLGLRGERRSARGFGGRSAPLVDRREALDRFRTAWNQARAGEEQIRLLVGAPGIGKSRLVEELISAHDLERAQVARGRSYPYAGRTPWEPISELLHSVYALPSRLDPDRAAATLARRSTSPWTQGEVAALSVALGRDVGAVTGLAGQSPAERRTTVWRAVTRALSSAGSEPRLLVLEDLQWADSTTLEYLAALEPADLSGPLLLVLVTRSALPDESGLEGLLESPVARVELGPLEPEESLELLDRLLGDHGLPDSLLERISGRAEGNPLFLEEILNSMSERGELRRENGRWQVTGDPEGLEVPDGVESLLTTRMDALPSSTKRVLQYASVVGRRFWAGVLAEELAERPVAEDLDRLQEGELVRPLADSRVPGDREFAFRHLLLQEVAYDSLLSGRRRELHGAVARWLERRAEDDVPEYHDLIAHHWERSDEPERAVSHLEAAGRQARAHGALQDARSSVDRALEIAPEAEVRRRLLGLAEDLAADLGEPGRRAELIEELEGLSTEIEAGRPEAEAAFRRARLCLATGRLERAREAATRALELFGRDGNPSREGDTLSLLGRIAHLWGDYEEARRRYEDSLALQRRAGDRYGEAEILDRAALVKVDVGRFEEALDGFGRVRSICAEIGAPTLEARCVAHRATALHALGSLAEAETAARDALELAEESGSRRARASAELTLARILGDRDRSEEATERLDRVLAFADESDRSAMAARARLARAELEEGEEGIHWTREARTAAAESGLVHVEVLASAREAEIRLALDDTEEADRLSQRSVERLEEHGNIQGPEERIYWTRARVLRDLGPAEEAQAVVETARSVVQQKASWISDEKRRRRFLESVPVEVSAVSAEEGP